MMMAFVIAMIISSIAFYLFVRLLIICSRYLYQVFTGRRQKNIWLLCLSIISLVVSLYFVCQIAFFFIFSSVTLYYPSERSGFTWKEFFFDGVLDTLILYGLPFAVEGCIRFIISLIKKFQKRS